MPTSPSDQALQQLDVREIPPREKHASILRLWTSLSAGSRFVLINDHDPVPLYYQFAAQFPGSFAWDYLEQGPDVFRVRITRLAATATPVIDPPRPVATPPVAPGSSRPASATEVDARGLEPPEPMIRILEAAARVPAGGSLRARTDRRPIHLFGELDARGLRHESTQQPDGGWLTVISHP